MVLVYSGSGRKPCLPPFADCSHRSVVTDPFAGEMVCARCGSVLKERLPDSTSPEHPMIDVEDFVAMSRTGTPNLLSYSDRGLSTTFSPKPVKDVSASAKKYRRLKKIDSQREEERRLVRPLTILNTISGNLYLPLAATERAAHLIRKALKANFARGRRMDEVVGACVYAACRLEKVPRSLSEVADISNVPKNDLARAYRRLLYHLNLKIETYGPEEFLSNIASKLKITMKTRKVALEMLDKIREGGRDGRHPVVLCAAVLWLASLRAGESISKTRLAQEARTTPSSIRATANSILKESSL